jgi:hypothetical protein
MVPGSRLLAGLLLFAALSWIAIAHDSRSKRVHWSLSHADESDDVPCVDNGAAADLEARWIGHSVVVQHMPTEEQSRFAARLDTEGKWTSEPADEDAGAVKSTVTR